MTKDKGKKLAESIGEKTFKTNDKQREKPTRLIDENPSNSVETEEENRS